MSDLYADCHIRLQEAQGSTAMAALLDAAIVHDALTEQDAAFIASRDMLFLSTVDPAGRPTVSYKGGAPGFCQVRDGEIAFPWYDGNGMFYSAGNVSVHPEIGLLFIDFIRPNRLRVQGHARLVNDASAWPGARFAVHVRPTHVFPNCGRYIHAQSPVAVSPHVPDAAGVQPVAAWKRIDFVQEALGQADRAAVAAAGCITIEDYGDIVAAGGS